ncbi:hypothetical protein JB92DRAFT_2886180, partial [Gautieria morchelliformis]
KPPPDCTIDLMIQVLVAVPYSLTCNWLPAMNCREISVAQGTYPPFACIQHQPSLQQVLLPGPRSILHAHALLNLVAEAHFLVSMVYTQVRRRVEGFDV